MVEYYSHDYNNDIKCKLDACKTFSAITDSERGEVVCGGCGLILVQNMEDTSHDSNSHTMEDFFKLTRTGPATSLTMHDQGLSTIIGNNQDSTGKALSSKTKYEFSRLRTWDNRSKSRKIASATPSQAIEHS